MLAVWSFWGQVPYSYTEADGSLLSLFTDDWRVIGLTEVPSFKFP